MKTNNGDDYISECWPKESIWVDFMKKEARDYLKGLYATVPKGCDNSENYIWNDKNVLIWNDMNEPACFNQTESTMLKSNTHTISVDEQP